MTVAKAEGHRIASSYLLAGQVSGILNGLAIGLAVANVNVYIVASIAAGGFVSLVAAVIASWNAS